MRDRQQRLQWIEGLIGGKDRVKKGPRALVVPSAWGEVAVAFDAIAEIVPGTKVQPFAFLPSEFCGVVDRGTTLAPVIDLRERKDMPPTALMVAANGCELGFLYTGTPRVADLEAPANAEGAAGAKAAARDAGSAADAAGALPALPAVLAESGTLQTPEGPAHLLDPQATITRLLDLE